jgi:hypothetical protein
MTIFRQATDISVSFSFWPDRGMGLHGRHLHNILEGEIPGQQHELRSQQLGSLWNHGLLGLPLC